MQSSGHIRPAYSRAERLSDGVVHVVGVFLAMIAVPLLIVLTVLFRMEPAPIVGVTVYGVTLIAMLSCSALYNMVDSAKWTGLLRRLDHSAIYMKIAGTYTPFVLVSGVSATGLLAGLWGAATVGSLLKMLAPHRFKWFSLMLYLVMGWAVLLAGGPIIAGLSPAVFWMVAAGGIVYTLGVGFHLAARLPFHNTIWHVFVLAGSVLFFIAVAVLIAGLPMGGNVI
ncbi:hemolysin III family protein [Hoeflea prorocentri]|uniref:Hemolysin III family protein n=2 Tax=Hoeflea prorocentri TaxID=1922333 RepID=A0A9X3UJZ2_9HYPH|nr:hemolysin III family protein [Hoeflea prorocentri]MDA5398324.1 hemolysin III family protein [Hoeflea prorocentri]